jgi:hypothetical protein
MQTFAAQLCRIDCPPAIVSRPSVSVGGGRSLASCHVLPHCRPASPRPTLLRATLSPNASRCQQPSTHHHPHRHPYGSHYNCQIWKIRELRHRSFDLQWQETIACPAGSSPAIKRHGRPLASIRRDLYPTLETTPVVIWPFRQKGDEPTQTQGHERPGCVTPE